MRGIALALLAFACASPGPRAPADDSLAALRFELAANPTDLAVHLALARRYDGAGLPGGALRHFDVVRRNGSLPAADARRMAELLVARAALRIELGDGAAAEDLQLARRLGAPAAAIDPHAVEAGFLAALAAYRWGDEERQRAGDRLAARAAALAGGDPRGAAANPGAAPLADLAAAAAWLDAGGARRAALGRYEHYVHRGGRDPAHLGAYLRLHRWWHGDRRAPEAATLQAALATSADTCGSAPSPEALGCGAALERIARDEDAALHVARRADRLGWRSDRPERAGAWTTLALRRWLAGETRGFGVDLGRRVDLAAVAARADELPAFAAATVLRLAGDADGAAAALDGVLTRPPAEPSERAVVLIEAAVQGRGARELEAFGRAGPDDALLAVARARVAARERAPEPSPAAAARWFHALDAPLAASWEGEPPPAPAIPLALVDPSRVAADAGVPEAAEALGAIAAAYLREPAVADRRAERFADRAVAAGAHVPALVQLFHELGDPARAMRWSARLLAESPMHPPYLLWAGAAAAAEGDPERAEVFFQRGAAASGDAGAASLEAARSLLAFGHPVHALGAGKRALQLTAPGEAQEVLAVVASADRALGRELAARAAERRLPARRSARDDALAGEDLAALRRLAERDPTDAALAAAVLRLAGPEARGALERAARWNPRDAELLATAGQVLPGEAGARWLARAALAAELGGRGFAAVEAAASARDAHRLADAARRRSRPGLWPPPAP